MLKLKIFKCAEDVTTFVNEQSILQGDIQALLYNERSNTYYLYYWR